MVPAHERFEAGDFAVDMRLRLVMQFDLAAGDRAAQVLLQRAFFSQRFVHRHFEEADRAARFRFGAEQRGTGIGDQGGGVGTILREDGDTDRQSRAQRVTVDVDIGIERPG